MRVHKVSARGVKATTGKPVFEVCGEVVSEKLSATSALSLLGTFLREFPGGDNSYQIDIGV